MLGVRRVTSLAPSAFLVSAAGTGTLQQQLLLRSTQAGSTDTAVTSVRDVWSSLYNTQSFIHQILVAYNNIIIT